MTSLRLLRAGAVSRGARYNQFDWLRDEGKRHGWQAVKGAAEAQRLANEGNLVVATFKAADAKKPGHIALVRPWARTEAEIQKMVAQGWSNGRIAQHLTLSDKTVRNHVSNILTKLQVPDRAQAIVRAREAGLGESPG